jgi:glycerol-1-phosphatase
VTSGDDSLISTYDLIILDLDGVVYLGHEPIAGAVDAVNRLTEGGMPVAYATNNASRRATEVAELLRSLGVAASPDAVVTSAQASAALLARQLEPGGRVLVIGGPALRAEVSAVGLAPVADASAEPAAVVQGYSPDVGWAQLAEGCVAIRAGASWIATNADRTLPSPRGPLPGNGSLVAVLATALDRQPDSIVGKPAPTLFTTAAARTNARRPLVVGDRLDTDIAGAVRAGYDGMLVLTGVSQPADVLAAPEGARPTWIAQDLRAFADGDLAARVPTRGESETTAESGGWTARHADGGLILDGGGTDMAALGAVAAMAWRSSTVPAVSAATEAAASALRRLGLG